MIDLYYFPTPNTWKITIFLEETEMEYRVLPVNILEGDQLSPEFLKVSPNGRVPAIVDHSLQGLDGKPLHLMESGAILIYLAEKTGHFLPSDTYKRAEVLQWLMWQMAGMGPIGGQANYFNAYCPEDLPLAKSRFTNEVARLWKVLDKQLESRQWIANDEYSLADMACWGWVSLHDFQRQNLDVTPNLSAWFDRMSRRPAVQRALAVGADIVPTPGQISDGAKSLLYAVDAKKTRQ
ncbi:MAG: GST-like protein [Alcanivorax sp.]|jgi:GST-like protein